MRTVRVRSFCILLAAMALVVAFSAPVVALAEPVDLTVAEIVEMDRGMDGATVRFVGEAIGEDLHADHDHRWVNVLGDGVAVGVYVTNEEAAQIETFGDHTHQGATVEVVGVVNVGCDDHGGEFDIHAIEFDVVEPGTEIERPIEAWKGIVGGLAILAALVVFRLFTWLQARRYE